MSSMISSCGVICSDCPAYMAASKGAAHQKRTATAWRRIYGLEETADRISCGGCLGPDEQLFHSSRACAARRCCRSKGYATCAECQAEGCPDLERAQSMWDEVPEIAKALSRPEFVAYAQPYCDHRRRLYDARRAFENTATRDGTKLPPAD